MSGGQRALWSGTKARPFWPHRMDPGSSNQQASRSRQQRSLIFTKLASQCACLQCGCARGGGGGGQARSHRDVVQLLPTKERSPSSRPPFGVEVHGRTRSSSGSPGHIVQLAVACAQHLHGCSPVLASSTTAGANIPRSSSLGMKAALACTPLLLLLLLNAGELATAAKSFSPPPPSPADDPGDAAPGLARREFQVSVSSPNPQKVALSLDGNSSISYAARRVVDYSSRSIVINLAGYCDVNNTCGACRQLPFDPCQVGASDRLWCTLGQSYGCPCSAAEGRYLTYE